MQVLGASGGSNPLLDIDQTLELGTNDPSDGTGTLGIYTSGEKATARSVTIHRGEVFLAGGELEARVGDIDSSSVSLVHGNGTIKVAGTFNNNGTLRASTGTLTITGPLIANPSVDLDGDNNQGSVEAITGNLQVNIDNDPLFRRAMTIGAGHFVDLPNAWELGSTGDLALNGSATQGAELRGGDLGVRGQVTVDRQGRLAVNVKTLANSNGNIDIPDSNDTLTITEKLEVAGGRIEGNGVLVVGNEYRSTGGQTLVDNLEFNDEALILGGSVRANEITANASALYQNAGTLEFGRLSGNLLHDGGVWKVGRTQVDGDVTTTKDGHVEFTISDSGTFDALQVAGGADLSGELSVELLGGYLPTNGLVFPIVTTGSLVSDLKLVGPHAHRFMLLTGPGEVALQAIGTINGDYNDDGVVDAADYTVWRDNEGSSTVLPGDPTPGVVNASDYATWRANYGATASPTASPIGNQTAAPEPTGCVLLAAATLLMTASKRRRT